MARHVVVVAVSAACGGSLGIKEVIDGPSNDEDGGVRDAAALAESGGDAALPCRSRPWAAPRLVDGVSTTRDDGSPTLSNGENELIFASRRSIDGGVGSFELRIARRGAVTDPFGASERLPGANSDAEDSFPSMTPDGLTLVFVSSRQGSGSARLFHAERPSTGVDFSAARPIAWFDGGPSNPLLEAAFPSITPDRSTLYFSGRDLELYRVYRAELLGSGDYGAPVREESLDDTASSVAFLLSQDRLTFFVSRATDAVHSSIHSAVRATTTEPFGKLEPVEALNEGAVEAHVGWLSADNCRLYLSRRRADAPDFDIYVAERQPQGLSRSHD